MRTWIGSTFALALLGISPFTTAQQGVLDDERFSAAEGCRRESASRVSASLECGEVRRDPIVVRTEIPGQPIVVEMPAVVINDCEAIIKFEYTQRASIARVEGQIENETCAASSGSFTVSLRTSNDAFEQSTVDHQETWQRTDNEPVTFSRDYEIGDDVDLIRVRTSKSVCKCTAPE